MAVESVNNSQPPSDAQSQAEFDTALDEAMGKGMVMIGQYVVMPMIKEATGDADGFSDDE